MFIFEPPIIRVYREFTEFTKNTLSTCISMFIFEPLLGLQSTHSQFQYIFVNPHYTLSLFIFEPLLHTLYINVYFFNPYYTLSISMFSF